MTSTFFLRTAHCLAVPMYVAQEEVELGQNVFQQFVHEEFEQEGVDPVIFQEAGEPNANEIYESLIFPQMAMEPHEISGADGDASTPGGYKSISATSTGLRIRQLANEFAQSKQRKAIKKEADEVDLSALTKDHFWLLLGEVFKEGITATNLIALFFFCSDVLIRCIRLKLKEIGLNLFKWSMIYIAEKVVTWVHNNGGWERALVKAVDTTIWYAGATVCAVGIVAMGYLMLRR